tara:strand:- start:5718 stop:6173 length:456 start_codon:yes stop_codon:yes gene_type:complete
MKMKEENTMTDMRVEQVMSKDATFIAGDTNIRDAAVKMGELNCGFLPIADDGKDKLLGVVTDRDIALRGVAEGKDPLKTTVNDVKSDGILYCFQGDSIEKAARSMRDQKVYRLVVLDGEDSKRFCGVISLNDIVRHQEEGMAARAAQGIAN